MFTWQKRRTVGSGGWDVVWTGDTWRLRDTLSAPCHLLETTLTTLRPGLATLPGPVEATGLGITPPSFLKCHQPGIMRWVWWPSDEIIASGYNWTIRAVKTSQTEAIIRRFDCKQNATQHKGAAPLPLLIRQSPADFKDGSERGESVTVRKRFLET